MLRKQFLLIVFLFFLSALLYFPAAIEKSIPQNKVSRKLNESRAKFTSQSTRAEHFRGQAFWPWSGLSSVKDKDSEKGGVADCRIVLMYYRSGLLFFSTVTADTKQRRAPMCLNPVKLLGNLGSYNRRIPVQQSIRVPIGTDQDAFGTVNANGLDAGIEATVRCFYSSVIPTFQSLVPTSAEGVGELCRFSVYSTEPFPFIPFFF